MELVIFKQNTPTLECLLECMAETLDVDIDRHYLENGYSQIVFTADNSEVLFAILAGFEIIEDL